MGQQVNAAVKANPALKNASPSQMYDQVVEPWLKQKGAYVPSDAIVSSNGTANNGAVDSLLTGLLGDWMGGKFTAYGPGGVPTSGLEGVSPYIYEPPAPFDALTSGLDLSRTGAFKKPASYT